jgi:hypothetical protein
MQNVCHNLFCECHSRIIHCTNVKYCSPGGTWDFSLQGVVSLVIFSGNRCYSNVELHKIKSTYHHVYVEEIHTPPQPPVMIDRVRIELPVHLAVPM